ncbi:hypothetical protein MHBO_000406 [Bonamia ostreae]|uniref:Uncharacterized protein n=1 Tax=Bonamia ostreae TaxID=126728 RepID=A0ABV2AFL1_9EUKA
MSKINSEKTNIWLLKKYYENNVLLQTKKTIRKDLKKRLENTSPENVKLKTQILEFVEDFVVAADKVFDEKAIDCDMVRLFEEIAIMSEHSKIISNLNSKNKFYKKLIFDKIELVKRLAEQISAAEKELNSMRQLANEKRVQLNCTK